MTTSPAAPARGTEGVLLPTHVEGALKHVRDKMPTTARLLREHCEKLELARTAGVRLFPQMLRFVVKAAQRGSSLATGKDSSRMCSTKNYASPVLLLLVDGAPIADFPTCLKHSTSD